MGYIAFDQIFDVFVKLVQRLALTFMGNHTTVNLSIVMSMMYHEDVVMIEACAKKAKPHERSVENTLNHCQ